MHFHRMEIYGGCAAAGFAVRLIWWIVAIRKEHGEIAVLSAGEILLALVFVVLCEALAKLIKYAYDVKHENDFNEGMREYNFSHAKAGKLYAQK